LIRGKLVIKLNVLHYNSEYDTFVACTQSQQRSDVA